MAFSVSLHPPPLRWVLAILLALLLLGATVYGAVRLDETYRASAYSTSTLTQCPLGLRDLGRWIVNTRDYAPDC